MNLAHMVCFYLKFVFRSKNLDGQSLLLDGWLNNPQQQQIFLQIFGKAFNFFDSKLSQRQFAIRIIPCDVRLEEVFKKR